MATLIDVKHPVFMQGVHYMTSPFGYRSYKVGGRTVNDHHDGIDLAAKYVAADHVIAFADGTVEDCLDYVKGTAESRGNYVRLYHAVGVYTVYYHLREGSVRVKKGQRVKKGDVLGYMGSSGNSTGPHLHFGVMRDSRWVDPLPYLEGKESLLDKKEFKGGHLDGINLQRTKDSLVLYLKKPSTGTNKWGTEVPIDVRGVVLSPPVYGVGNMAIPKGGKVLSGHGLAGD